MKIVTLLFRPVALVLEALVILAGVLVFNALTLPSRQIPVEPVTDRTIDEMAVAQRLSQAIRFQTVSSLASENSGDEWRKLREFLERAYPKVHARLNRRVVNGASLLFTWEGKNKELGPVLLTAHLDVVPADPARWTADPFTGAIKDQFIWGRGSLDDKVSVLGILEAAESLLGEGFEPNRTFYFGFGQDEEVRGQGARAIAALLKQELKGAKLDCVVDEGTAIVEDMVAGFDKPVAPIGLVEKGYVDVVLRVHQPGGHSSVAPPRTAIGILGRAIDQLERQPMPTRLTSLTRESLETVGAELPFNLRLIFANLWLFGGPVQLRLAASPETNAMVRTTAAVTVIEGGTKDNVLPEMARATVNYRVLSGDTIEDVRAHIVKVIGDPRVEVNIDPNNRFPPSHQSSTRTDPYARLQETIRAVFPGTVVIPFMVTAGTDARHYEPVCDNIYRFLPIRLIPRDLDRIHGIDERVGTKNYARVVVFYRHLIRTANEDRNKGPESPAPR
jgi:carboxypeptidase PM20D1